MCPAKSGGRFLRSGAERILLYASQVLAGGSSSGDRASSLWEPSLRQRVDATLLHEQAAAAIRRAISDGEAGPGDRIPLARDLATVLGVNRNTVLRALRLLRHDGLFEMGCGRTIRVTATPEQGAVIAKTRDLIEFARQRGYGQDEVIAIINSLG